MRLVMSSIEAALAEDAQLALEIERLLAAREESVVSRASPSDIARDGGADQTRVRILQDLFAG